VNCTHITDPVLVTFYAEHPRLICARCFHADRSAKPVPVSPARPPKQREWFKPKAMQGGLRGLR